MILLLASSKRASAGLPFANRISNARERSTIRPGMLMSENLIVFILLGVHDFPKAIPLLHNNIFAFMNSG